MNLTFYTVHSYYLLTMDHSRMKAKVDSICESPIMYVDNIY